MNIKKSSANLSVETNFSKCFKQNMINIKVDDSFYHSLHSNVNSSIEKNCIYNIICIFN